MCEGVRVCICECVSVYTSGGNDMPKNPLRQRSVVPSDTCSQKYNFETVKSFMLLVKMGQALKLSALQIQSLRTDLHVQNFT